MTVSSNLNRASYTTSNATTHSFAYSFKIFADADLTVIVRSTTGVETTKTLGTNYIVNGAGSSSGGTVFFKFNTGTSSDSHYSTTDHRPASGETVILLREQPLTQGLDLVANDPFPAASFEDALDKLTFMAQQHDEEIGRTIKLSKSNTMTSPEFTTSATDRANKVLAFDSSGELSVAQELGTFKGTSATTTTAAFTQRDIVKGSTTAQLNNIYICVADSVAGDTLTDTDHFALLVDAVSAATSATNAASSATSSASSASTASGHKDTATAQAAIATNKAADAGKYAVTAEDSQFTLSDGSTTGFSALHYSAKASASATAAASSASAASSSQTAAASSATAAAASAASITTGISDGNIPVFTSGVVDDDFLRISGTSVEGRSSSEVLSDIGGQASLTFGISNTNAVKVDSSSVADDEYARFTANGLESRSTSEVLSDIGGQASLTFGISNTNAVQIDSSSVTDDEYARFTSNGLESRSASETRTDLGLVIGTDVQAFDADIVAKDIQNTFTKAQVPSTYTAALSATSGVLDYDTYQNFIITLASGANTLAAPTTEASQIGQTGVIVFIQPSSSSAGTVSLHGDYESVNGGGLSLSSTNNQYDVVPYFVKADNSILLGSPSKAFS